MMKIATFNVNSIRSRIELVLDWLKKNEPDVFCVQETKVQDCDFPNEAFEDSGYNVVFSGQKQYNGVAIFSRSMPDNVSFGLDDEPKDQSRLIKAEVKGVAIVNTYVPQGYMPDSDKFDYKLKWFARLREYFSRHFKPDDPVLWLGDFNVAPQAKDVYDPEGLWGHVCYCQKVQDALAKVAEWGFVDLFRQHCDQPGWYTFWDYRLPNSFKRNLGWRLDHIMATKILAGKCTCCQIDKEPRMANKPSDHTIISALLNI